MTFLAQVKARLDDESGFGLVETLIALTILVIGLIAVSGLSLASASQARIANWRSQQASVAQMVLEEVQSDGWGSAVSAVDTVNMAVEPFCQIPSGTAESTADVDKSITLFDR